MLEPVTHGAGWGCLGDGIINPVSPYVYPQGSTAHQWSLQASSWAKVTGITYLPWSWNLNLKLTNFHEGAVMLLEGCVDTREGGLGLIPECMRNELREIRSVIEAHSKGQKLQGRELASANGLGVSGKGNDATIRVKLKDRSSTMLIKIDRLD